MKRLVPFAFAVVASLTVSVSAHAYSQDEFADAMGNLGNQAEKLARQSDRRCEADYKSIYANKTVRISMFYGYEDFDEVTADTLHAKSMVKMLTSSCHGNMGACGFKKIESSSNIDRLQKDVRGKRVIVSVYSTSRTEDTQTNMDPHDGYWKQDKVSREIKAAFHHDLQAADVVFYAGHSRHGSGFGFDPQSIAQHAVNYLFKAPLQDTLAALSQRPSRLKLFGVMSCTSEEFYRGAIESVNPNVSLALTKVDLEASNGEQIQLGLLNSILTQKCTRELEDSVRAENSPGEDAITFVNR